MCTLRGLVKEPLKYIFIHYYNYTYIRLLSCFRANIHVVIFLHEKFNFMFYPFVINQIFFRIIYPHTLHFRCKGTLKSLYIHVKVINFFILFCLSSLCLFKCTFNKLFTLISILVLSRAISNIRLIICSVILFMSLLCLSVLYLLLLL